MAASVAWFATRGIAGQCIGRLAVAKTRYTEMGAAGDSGDPRRFNGLLFQSGISEFSTLHLMSFAWMWASLLVYMGVAFVWLRRVARWSRTDALLAVYPGALAAVLDLFHLTRASNHVVLVHVLRLFVLTLLVTILIPAAPLIPAANAELSGVQHGLPVGLLLVAIVGVGLLLRRLHVPAPYLLTAMVLTAWAMHAGYVPSFAVPSAISDGTTCCSVY